MPRTWLVVLVAAPLLLAGAAHGQVNTERMRALDVEGVRTTLGGDLALQSGNVDLFEVGLTARLDVQRGSHYAFFAGELRYGTSDDVPFRDRTFGHFRYNYRLGPWLVAEGFTQGERDGFARLQLRTLAGGGLRVQYLDTEPVQVVQGTTPMYEYENLDGSDLVVHPATVSTVRWSNYLNMRLRFVEGTHLLTTVYVQPRLDDFADTRVLTQAALVVAVTEHVRLTTALDLRYDSRPPDEVEDLDLALRNGLQVSF